MRSFEQYINESRQKYIFGGTDNRRPKITKTIGELEEGDIVFYCDTKDSFYTSYDVIGLKGHAKDEFLIVVHSRVYRSASPGKLMVNERGRNMSTYVDEYEEGEYDIISTDYKEFVDKIKEVVGIDVTDIKGYTANEARQNYIFGGTDNRNTNVAPKTFAEIDKGDTIYYYWESKQTMNKCVEAFIFVKLDDNIFYDNKVEMKFIRKTTDGDEWGCFSLEKDKLTNSVLIRDEEKHFSILATSKDEFLKQVEEHTGKTDIEIENFTGKELDEARQNYIFGGTDNRGTDDEVVKSFKQLVAGDKLFYYNGYVLEEYEVREVTYDKAERYYNIYYFNVAHKRGVLYVRHRDGGDSAGYSAMIGYCYATSFEKLKELVKEKMHVDIYEKDVKRYEAVF